MGENPDNPDVSMKQVHSEVQELKSEFNDFMESPEPTQIKSKDELVSTLQNLEKENDSVLVELDKDVEVTSKEEVMEDIGGLMDYLEENLQEENFSMLMDAVRGSEDEVEEEMDEEEDEDKAYDEDEDKEKTAKHKAKGKQGIGTDKTTSKSSISYADLVEG